LDSLASDGRRFGLGLAKLVKRIRTSKIETLTKSLERSHLTSTPKADRSFLIVGLRHFIAALGDFVGKKSILREGGVRSRFGR